MSAIGVIPARYASTRFEGKVLAKLVDKPVIQHVWEKATKCKVLNEVIIACDDKRIQKVAESFGARVVMTSPDHKCGSDRIAEAVESLAVDVIINIQGDEPLIDPKVIDNLTQTLLRDESCQVATVIKQITDSDEFIDPNVVKVVIDKNKDALYFSRAAIPASREKRVVEEIIPYKHFGIYAYRKKFLLEFTKLPQSHLEKTEQLEQLRIVEAGYKIRTIETDSDTIGIDTKEDLARVEAFLRKENKA